MFGGTMPEHLLFPACEQGHIDPTHTRKAFARLGANSSVPLDFGAAEWVAQVSPLRPGFSPLVLNKP